MVDMALAPAPSQFEKVTWKCPCCQQERQGKYIRTITHDVSSLYKFDSGTIVINCKYCVDMPICQEKAFNREWVINHFLPKMDNTGHE